MHTEITISVRHLVEFLLRSGDLDNRIGGGSEDAMLEGARMHRKLQQEAGPEYMAEVPLEIEWSFKKALAENEAIAEKEAPAEKEVPAEEGLPAENAGQNLLPAAGEKTESKPSVIDEALHKQFLDDAVVIVQGRADGIFLGEDPDGETDDSGFVRNTWTIDEIKTTYRKLRRIAHPEPVHLAQAKCYAYFYAVKMDLPCVNVRMTYVNLINNEIRYFYEKYTRADLEKWFTMLMEEYRRFAEYSFTWQIRRTQSIKPMEFPFPYREGQRDLAAGVYHTIMREKKLFLEAPTGTGKTITTLFPSVKAMGEGKAERIFYLTAKTITRTAAENAIEVMRAKGLKAKSVVLTAKEKICPFEKAECNPEACPRAKGHYDRVNAALYHLMTTRDSYTREAIEACAEEYEVCPFELSLDMSLFSDVIIGDYNYLFDPHAYLRRFFGDGDTKGDYIFLVDEAHNLVDRGRDMYSAELVREEVMAFRRLIQDLYPELDKKLKKCSKALLDIKKRCLEEADQTGCLVLEEMDQLADSVYAVDVQMADILARERIDDQSGQKRKDPVSKAKKAVHDEFLDFYFMIDHFVMIYELADDHYVKYMQIGEDGLTRCRLFCVDPSANLAHCMARGKASVLFSATFLPIQYYKSLLGGTKEDYEAYARSVFDPARRKLLLINDVTSRYARRSDREFERIADCIYNITGRRHGNYMVFFPSYAFMKNTADIFENKYMTEKLPDSEMPEISRELQSLVPGSQIICIRQKSGMTEADREEFLQMFERNVLEGEGERSLIGFCVLGGIFSEGIDLKNDSLIGSVIVGTGLPLVCGERELLKRYFDKKGETGYDYAYRYPGMNKVLQAAGRVIRTSEDTGIVALLDDRFTSPSYRKLFPQEWSDALETDSQEAGLIVEKFWNEWM